MAKYKPNKNKKTHVKKLQEIKDSGFGEYKESTGGGHPFEAGNSNTRTTQENGKLRKSENAGKTDQPRDRGGHFTYKSVNGKSIDPKYGPSRGKTVNPLLTGGDGTIKIEDVEKEFKKESGAYWDKYKDKWYKKGGKVITEGLSTQVSASTIWELAKKKYDTVKGEFEGESENWSTKGGKKSATEKEAIEKVQETGEQQYVIDPENKAIETKDKIKKFIEEKKEPAAPVQETPAPEEKTEEQVEEQEVAWGKSGKFTNKQADKARMNIKNMMGDEYDEEFWTDDVLEEFMESNPEIYG